VDAIEMSAPTIWCEFSGFAIPESLNAFPIRGEFPEPEILASIKFYVPPYMAGARALEPISKMTSLEVIQSPNAGVDDLLEILPPGVTLCNAKGVHEVSTAELTVGLTISVRRGLATFMANQSKGLWIHDRHNALADSRVGIVGMGSIGSLIARQLEPFNVEVIGFSRSGNNLSNTMADFDDLLPTLDVVILILPLNEQSHHLMNRTRINSMKAGATLINMARGPIVDTDALVDALNRNHITAGLDVTDPEPLPVGHPLWSAPNVIITPHVGGDSSAFNPRVRALIESQLKRFATGQPLENIVAGPLR
jgi:phosphoglycerate dehydrogenase-like enzyme